MAIYITPRPQLELVRQRAIRRARMEELEDALREIARKRIMDSLTAIHMRAIAIGALWPEDNRFSDAP